MIAPVIFNLIWIIGGFIQPGYSHIRDDVSTLMASGAPNKLLFDIMHIAELILIIIFLIGLLQVMRDLGNSFVAPILFLISQSMELTVTIFFPLDYGGEITTLIGTMHFILVVILGFIAMGGMFTMWFELKKVDEWKGYDVYSLITFICTLTLGLFLSMTAGSEIMGLIERFVIVANGQYFFVIALKVYLTSE